ncbi:GGDEF domain-containing protein [Paenibacillus sp. YPG26]|uniref:GGDEF domain-containing protein n=1 Tax=Paenibacillus sp. YPG26 TaxID=2878915 RepID=UPI00203DB769|nr:GGDEF domain-containing protein [Paenibacillus sp. YPG26]USB31782.1 GGDEF domain-containing protein [Paenibacillus sp. YPG26]
MKYYGRIYTVLIVVGFQIIDFLNRYFNHLGFNFVDSLSYTLTLTAGFLVGRKYDQAVFYSQRDELTTLYNRRFLSKFFSKLSPTERTKYFVLVIDCDNFKVINDTYGHHMGDLVLQRAGAILISSTRKKDIVARWGGDEFVIIGHYEGKDAMRNFMQRLNEQFHDISSTFGFPVSISLGYSLYSHENEELQELLRLADRNMYVSKEGKKSG